MPRVSTGLFGTFNSADDSVSIYNTIVNGVAMWVLDGTRGTGSPGGRAFCFIGRPVAFAGSWSPGSAPALLGLAAGRACFFTRVQGNFAPGNQSLRIVPIWDVNISAWRWGLEGSDLTRASAGCVNQDGIGDFGLNAQGSTLMTALTAGNGPSGCALDFIYGYLGGGAHVEASVVDFRGVAKSWLASETQGTIGTVRQFLSVGFKCFP